MERLARCAIRSENTEEHDLIREVEMKSSGDDFGGIAWRIIRTSLAETLGRVSSMDEEWQGSGKVKIKRKEGQLGRDSQYRGMDLGCEEVGERGGKASTFFFGSGKIVDRRLQQFLRHTSSFTGITTTVQPLLKASPSRRPDDLIGDATAATISNTVNVPTSCSERSFQTAALSFYIFGLFRQLLCLCL